MIKNYSLTAFFNNRFIKPASLLFALFFTTLSASFSQSTYTWNSTGTADWTVAANWLPLRNSPAPDDILKFNNGATTTATNIPNQTIGQLLINNNTTVSLQAANSVTTLNISGATGGDDLIVNAGATLNSNGTNDLTLFVNAGATGNINGNTNFSNAAHRLNANDASGITFNSPAIFLQDVGCTGNAFTMAGTSNAIIFNSGTTFLQKDGANPFAKTAPASKVVFNSGSLFKVQSNLAASFSGRIYANVEIDNAAFSLPLIGTKLCSIDNLTVNQGVLNLNLTGGINIKGNISVASLATLNFNAAAANTISFNGSTPQSITNAGSLSFGDNEAIVFNNTTGVTVNNNIAFNNLVTFTAGVVRMVTPTILTLGTSASVVSVSSTSFVDGFVKKIGNTGFKFPVGKATPAFTGYVPIQITPSAVALTTDEYIAAYNRMSAVDVNNHYVIGLDHVSGVDYWSLSRTSGTTPVDVTLYWTNESSTGGSTQYINDKSKLVIAHYDGSSQWDDYGGEGAAMGGFAAGSITWPNVNLFTPSPNLFSLGSTDAAVNSLPINLNYLHATKQNTSNYLNWQVTCGANNLSATMILESSADGQNFDAITTITGDAVRCQQPFNYTDTHPLNGINYYRLKMVDAKGAITYSAITAINNTNIFNIVTLTPTVVNNTAVLKIIATQNTSMAVVITDITGKLVQKMNYAVTAGSNQFTINLANLAAGIYQIICYSAMGEYKMVRFIKV